MITAQRAFQANAQVITTANQLSQTVINITHLIMDRGLYVAMTGAKQIMQAQAVNNHNIANISTIGFRADSVSFDSEPIYGPGYATRVNAVAGDAGTDFSAGTMESTGRDLDIAVNGNGFIAVRGSDGQEAYTRAGDLRVSPVGAVTTASGLPVLTESGPLVIPPSTNVSIGSDGTVSVVPQGSAPFAVTQVDRIKLVNPPTADSAKRRRRLAAPQEPAARRRPTIRCRSPPACSSPAMSTPRSR